METSSRKPLKEFPFDDALNLACNAVSPLPVQAMPLARAIGFRSALQVFSTVSIPPHRNSAMDGWALPDPGSNDDGYFVAGSDTPVPANHAVRVLTGHSAPDWSFCVAAEEHCRMKGNRLFPPGNYPFGMNLREAGEDARPGDLLLSRGELLDPTRVARLASAGISRVHAHRQPKIVILTSGDELVRPGLGRSSSEQKYECDSILLHALLLNLGLECRILPHQPDSPAIIQETLNRLSRWDLLITCGGAANSEADHSRPVLASLGTTFLFERIAMKPGRPTAFGLWKNRPVFCLPGNPVAVFVAFHVLVRPVLDVLCGGLSTPPHAPLAVLQEAIPADPKRVQFVRITLAPTKSGLGARPYPDSGSALIRSLTDSDGLIRINPGVSLKAGDSVPLAWYRSSN